MARKKSSSPDKSPHNRPSASNSHLNVEFDIGQQIDELEQTILECFRIPLTRWTVIDEEKVLQQIDILTESIPPAIKKALAILEQEQQIREAADAHYKQTIEAAQQRAAQMLDQTGIIQQAELEASQIRYQVQQECEAMQRQTLAEVEQIRQITTQEITQFRQQAIADSQEIQQGADEYADRSLNYLEQRLNEMMQDLGQMLQVVRNGRQQIQGNNGSSNAVSPQVSPKKTKSAEKTAKKD